MDDITIYKLDHDGQEMLRYAGKIVARGETWIQLEALFPFADKDAGYVVFRRNDRFVEWFYSDRWYNIFEVHDVADDALKGWYCNITRPATLSADEVHSDDLALDAWVSLDGTLLVVDEDEFEALPFDADTRQKALDGVAALREHLTRRDWPFDKISATA
jgi:protein associated with RNAse G/E